jgi:hypothetical protein
MGISFRLFCELEAPPETQNFNPIDWQARNQQLQNVDPNSPINPTIRASEQLKAWKWILQTYFSGGTYHSDAAAEQKFITSGTGLSYDVNKFGKFIQFTIQRNSRGVSASVDFDWEDDKAVDPSMKDQNKSGIGGSVAGEMQAGSKEFAKYIQTRYIIPLHKYGINVHFDAADPRREKVYDRMLGKVGYEKVQDSKMSSYKPVSAGYTG